MAELAAAFGRQLFSALAVAITLLLLGFDSVANVGAALYVAVNGSDANAGTTPSAAWRTIQKAADMAKPGDRVLIQAGIYRERVVMKTSGMAGKPIVFEGVRGANGSWDTIIDGGDAVTGWVAAPEVGSGVWKKTGLGFTPGDAMTTGSDPLTAKRVWRIRDNLMDASTCVSNPVCPAEGAYGTGLQMLAFPSNQSVNTRFGPTLFWDGKEAAWGWRPANSTAYVKFRAGTDPNTLSIRMAPAGGVFTLTGKSYITIKNMRIQGGANAVLLQSGANSNIIENNVIRHGGSQIKLAGGSSNNIIRNNDMSHHSTGAGETGTYPQGNPRDGGSTLGIIHWDQYVFDKFSCGDGGGCENNVFAENGPATIVQGNLMRHGHCGVLFDGANGGKILSNTAHGYNACNFYLLGTNVNGVEIGFNHIYDGAYPIRIDKLDQWGSNVVYIYGNRIHQQVGHNMISSGCDPCPVKPGTLWIYHNSFSGQGYATGLGGSTFNNWHMANNVFSANVGIVDVGGGTRGRWGYNWSRSNIGGSNLINSNGVKMWINDATYAGPDFVLPAGSPARNSGLDLSQPFTLEGTPFGALPGMTGAYYGNGLPDMGALPGP